MKIHRFAPLLFWFGACAAPTPEATPDMLGEGACPGDVTPRPGTVRTDRGAVTGALAGATFSYKGIPFAAPPVGASRLRPPQPVACWGGELDARAWPPLCPQFDGNGTGNVVGSEDCLKLNVWTSEPRQPTPAPVLFWIHGGGHVQGSASSVQDQIHIYDGQHLAERTGAVVVTINYRLGPLGFLAHPALSDPASPSSGNLGTLDQIAALGWVQRNIAAFGGDPGRVTIFGESAGGVAVCSLLASPLARGLFHRAVMQSGGCNAVTRASAEAFGQKVAAAAKCDAAPDPAACLRGLSVEALLRALPVTIDVGGKGSEYGSVVDGVVLRDVPQAVIQAGAHNPAAFIVGSNSDETSRSVPNLTTEAEYRAAVTALFSVLAPRVLAAYPVTDYPSPRAAYVALTTDAKFGCGARRAARAARAGQREPVFRYLFSHALDNGGAVLRALGAWHGVDVLYVFDQIEGIGGYRPSDAERGLAAAMGGYWGRLAAAGDPNGGGAPPWPRYDETEPVLRLDSVIAVEKDPRARQCDFWDSLL